MNTVNSKDVLSRCIGATFMPVGPFLVADLTGNESMFNNIKVGTHGMEEVVKGQKTEPHAHDFPSFYKSKGLNVVSSGETFVLPEKAVTLVFPGDDHSWIPKEELGVVGSVDDRHEKQIVVAA